MKAIVLTCNTGQGHNSAGKAIQEEFQRRGGSCEVVDALSFLGKHASEIIAGAFVNIAVKTPHAFGFMYNAGEAISNDKLKSPVYFANKLYAENLYAYITQNHFDAAICPHLFPMEALTYLKSQRSLHTACFAISTDYTCIPFLEETAMDKVFIPHQELTDEFIRRGFSPAVLLPTGIPVSDKFKVTVSKTEARKQIGASPDTTLYLVMTGGEGCGNATDLTMKLLQRDPKSQVFVMTGHNKDLLAHISDTFKTDSRVKAIEFTKDIPVFMDACDVLLTKPGGLSSTEAAVKNVPFIHTPPIPGCETQNARFFSEHGMSVMAADDESAIMNACRLATDAPACLRMKEAQQQYINSNAAADIYDAIAASL